MPRPSARPWLTILVAVLLILVVTAALAWSARSARQEHRRVAEETVRDYARFAATLAASNVEAAMEQVLLYAFYGADLAERQGSSEPVSPRTLATNPPEMGRCAARFPGGRWFVRVAPDGRMDVEGPLDPELGGWVADTLVALQRAASSARYGNLFPSLPSAAGGPVVAYRLRRDERGRPVEAHALAHCFEGQEGSVFAEARRRGPLLPPTAGAGADSLITLAVLDPRGAVIHRSGPGGTGFVGARPADATGPLAGLRFQVSVPPALADGLVAGGIPAPTGGATWILVLLAVCLGAATLVQVYRSMALVRARERFVANVSHELRTPLQLVLLFAQLLRMDRARSAEERHEALEIIERETKRLIGLVERVLAFSRAGRTDPGEEVPERVDVAEVVRETVDAFRPMADGEGARLSTDLNPGLPPVRARPGLLRQVLLNLLENAVRYGPRGQQVVVRAVTENGEVDLMVDDQGPGIPAEDRERVWQPFQRLERPEAGGPAGSGIGLAVVRDAIDEIGGRVWIEEAPGAGTRVVVRLPAAGSAEEIR